MPYFARWVAFAIGLSCPLVSQVRGEDSVARDVRSILSNRCFACHGPDEEERQGGFRLDVRDSFLAEADSGEIPVVAGQSQDSELLRRILSEDEDERMPPEDFGGRLSDEEIRLISQWIDAGAELPQHWSFIPPTRSPLPDVRTPATGSTTARAWSHHAVDRFVLAQQLAHQLQPSPPASRSELLRRLSLDLIGLPPTLAEVQRFEHDDSPDAYERQVDRLLASRAYGEHWARKWLDLARYADSAGYADDPARTIWAYRDWVVQAINANMPIDQFTIEQLAGDLLDNPTQDQLIATAFHRNTLTNNEGGTNDEEFRNVAIVDRVNTTMAVWMGVTMACAQCHTHKYDPFTQQEYFQLFAILNQTQDADRRDESPTIELFTQDQHRSRRQWLQRIEQLHAELDEPTEQSLAEMRDWEAKLAAPTWHTLQPQEFTSVSQSDELFGPDGQITVQPLGKHVAFDTYTVDLTIPSELVGQRIQAFGLQTLPGEQLPAGLGGLSAGGNLILTDVAATLIPGAAAAESVSRQARYVRIDLPGTDRILSLAEVQVFSFGKNVSGRGQASQSSTAYAGDAKRAIDGRTDGIYTKNSTTHTETGNDPWWELDLKDNQTIDRIVLWNRTDNDLHSRLDGAVVQLLDEQRQSIFLHKLDKAPKESQPLTVQPSHPITFVAALADYSEPGFEAAAVVDGQRETGWSVGGQTNRSHLLTLIPWEPIEVGEAMRVRVELKHNSAQPHHLLESFALQVSVDDTAYDWALLSEELRTVHDTPLASRTDEQQRRLASLFVRRLAKSHQPQRDELQELQTKVEELKPQTSVPIMSAVARDAERQTFVQIRGNYKSLGDQVEPGTPAVFHPVSTPSSQRETPDRLALAKWLVDRRNPLTARVWVNRMWESLFGIGIVRSSEEFGSQGDAPSHPELLDWLACELMDSGWDSKRMLRLLVTSQTYRQTSQVSLDVLNRDQDNIWLSRGPRVRLSAEMVRDQALAASGLLSSKMYGEPVRPPQPNLGLKAAFGSGTDWKTSPGEDRYRRGLYTTWRRSNPYPSMATFDAPSREVCTLRRDSTNTPLQALVTLNDPGFVEAAQALARRVVLFSPELEDERSKIERAFQLCTSRLPAERELEMLADLLEEARQQLAGAPDAAQKLATDPLGPLPGDADPVELAAWTALGNVLLNLDEVLMKR